MALTDLPAQRTKFVSISSISATLLRMIPFTRRQKSGHVVVLLGVPAHPRTDCVQGQNLGKGGIDTSPSDERAPPMVPPHLVGTDTADSSSRVNSTTRLATDTSAALSSQPLPRETGQDIGMGSPVPLSAEAVGIITRLRNMKVRYPNLVPWQFP
jgi:hypothetical protein